MTDDTVEIEGTGRSHPFVRFSLITVFLSRFSFILHCVGSPRSGTPESPMLDDNHPNKGFQVPPTAEQFQAFAAVMGFPAEAAATSMQVRMLAQLHRAGFPSVTPSTSALPAPAPLALPKRSKAAGRLSIEEFERESKRIEAFNKRLNPHPVHGQDHSHEGRDITINQKKKKPKGRSKKKENHEYSTIFNTTEMNDTTQSVASFKETENYIDHDPSEGTGHDSAEDFKGEVIQV